MSKEFQFYALNIDYARLDGDKRIIKRKLLDESNFLDYLYEDLVRGEKMSTYLFVKIITDLVRFRSCKISLWNDYEFTLTDRWKNQLHCTGVKNIEEYDLLFEFLYDFLSDKEFGIAERNKDRKRNVFVERKWGT